MERRWRREGFAVPGIWLWLLASVGGAVLPCTVEAQAVVLDFGAPQMSVGPQADFEVPVRVRVGSTLDVASLQIKVTWLPGELTYRQVSSADFGNLTVNESSAQQGVLRIAGFQTSGKGGTFEFARIGLRSGADGSGGIINLTVEAIASEKGASLKGVTTSSGISVCAGVGGLIGDVNDDSGVDMVDAQQVARFAVGLSVTDPGVTAARGDVNSDGAIDLVDALQIARFALGLPTPGSSVGTALPASCGADTNPAGFSIEVRAVGTMTTEMQNAFAAAAARWAGVITGDLPAGTISVSEALQCGVEVGEDIKVDDLVIFAQVDSIDGEHGILGQAGPCWSRSDTYLPIMGIMTFDRDDLEAMAGDGTLGDVILHEMGHVIGIGSLWDRHGLLDGKGGSDPQFRGQHGVAAYGALVNRSETGVPVENTGEEGTRDSHWRESVFGNELMTGRIGGPGNPLSAISVQSLVDQGYAVDAASADSYAMPTAGAVRSAPRGPIQPWEVVLKPLGTLGSRR